MPLRLLWYAKDVCHPYDGMTRVVVPLAGGPPPDDCEQRLTAALERRWVTCEGQPYASALAISVDRQPRAMNGRAYWLVLVLYAGEGCARLHIDRMARHLRGALAQLEIGTQPSRADVEGVRRPVVEHPHRAA